jgi:hypothetical protein
MEFAGLIQHHLNGVLVLAKFIPFALLAATHSPRASLNSCHLLRVVLVVMALHFPFAMPIVVVMSSLTRCRLRLTPSRSQLDALHSRGRVGGSILVHYHHEVCN